MIDEKEFKKNLDNLSHNALVSFAYSLAVKNSALEENYQALSAQSGKSERLFRFIGAPFRFSGTLVKETGSAYSCH